MSFDALAKAKAGSWAEYTMTMNGKPQTMKMKYSMVEKTDKTMAIEVDSATPMGSILVHMGFAADGPDNWKMVAARMQMGASPPQDLPKEQMGQGGIKRGDSIGKLVGTESVKTAVGTFNCKHYQRDAQGPGGPQTIDMWMNDKALPTGMVKLGDQKGVTFVLSATGNDAKAKMDMNAKATTATPPPSAPPSSPPPSATPKK